ncbi:MAG: PAS domain-containing sensor histidine kinase [Oscillospiraceae bacterium]|nr:PAS domain-containing sensor histidine kinase [Oscillospiraceae bacterium]
MTKRIFQSISMAAFGVLLASIVLIMGVLYSYFTDVQQRQQWQQTELAAQGVAQQGMAYFDGLELDQCRITWVSANGTVLYDNQADVDSMENHLQREEILQAFESGYGQSVRHSATLLQEQRYTAQRLPDGSVLRLSTSRNSVLTLLLGVFQPVCVVILVAVALCLFVAFRLSKSIVEPLNRLDLDHPLENREYEELTPLLRRIDSQQRKIRSQAGELHQKRKEFQTITGKMKEGLVLLSETNRILSLNDTAMTMLSTSGDCVGKDIAVVNRTPEMTDLLLQARAGKSAEVLLPMNGRQYRMEVSPVLSKGVLSGVALLIMDVTEKEQAERLRREFTANVSHELKTPLHTISGCAELLVSGLVQPGDEQKFSRQIYTEAQRMICLVEDIIGLSRLDEGANDTGWEQVDLYQVACSVTNNLIPAAQRNDVTLSVTGRSAVVSAIPQMVELIVANLCSNAIKYNRAGGFARVDVTPVEEGVRLTVSDNGIGIPEEHQSRIFERFYRVDKSRSKEVGGTGLGLSIVKHAALIHDAKIELKSCPDQGTVISLLFKQ